MPRHDIEVVLPPHPVVNTDLDILVKSDGRALGRLLVSKGTIDWRPAKHRYTVTMPWETFAAVMDRWHRGEFR